MELEPSELRAAVQAWTRVHPGIFEVHDDPDGVRVVDVAAGKPLVIRADEIVELETRKNWSTGAEYVALQFSEHPPLALADAGFVFALDTRNTGPLEGAPPSMSFRDYRKLHAHLSHLMSARDDPQRRREALDLSLVLIASLDGARALGLPTQVEEAELEESIRRLEAGT